MSQPSVAPRHRTGRLGVGLASLVAVAVLATGCARESAAPSQADYVAAADAACERHRETIDELEAEVAAEPERARPDRWIRADLVPAYRDLSKSLRSLPPPDGDAAYLSGIYGDLDRRVRWLYSHPSAGRAAVRDDEGLRRRFAGYGMEVCGQV